MSRRKENVHRVKICASLIRQIKGKPLLEALYRLQDGLCAYDQEPCVLLLPQAVGLSSSRSLVLQQRPRFATVDHVVPRSLGGQNRFQNLVMASQIRNGEKGSFAPIDRWVPADRHTEAEIMKMIKIVDDARWMLARKMAVDRKLNKQQLIDKLVGQELRRTSSRCDFKFYGDGLAMVA